MAARRGRTQAVFYRDAKGREPVVGFLEELLTARPLAAAKIGEAIEEYLNGRSTDAPPPEFPISSQIEGELRELRVRFARTRDADRFTMCDKVDTMATSHPSPVGRSVTEVADSHAVRSESYRDARAEYAHIRALKEISPIAAHLRERRFELGLTQEQVAQAASTSHSAVSRLEKGTHIPQLPTLQRIAAVLDEELLVCFQRTVDGEVEREFAAVA